MDDRFDFYSDRDYFYEDCSDLSGSLLLLEEEEKITTSTLGEAKNKLSKVVQMIRYFLKKVTDVKGIKELKHIIVTILESNSFIKKYVDILRQETLEEKMERIKTVNNFSDILSLAFKFSNIAGRILYYTFNFIYMLHPGHFCAYLFENENKFRDYLFNHDASNIYKYVYNKFTSVGISEKFSATYICMLAFLTPMYVLFSLMQSSKDSAFDDPEFYDTKRIYFKTDSKTGLKKYEKMIIKSVDQIVNKYETLESDYDKVFYLSTNILKNTMKILLFLFIIYSPMFFKFGLGVDIILKWMNVILIGFLSGLLCMNFVITFMFFEKEKRKYKNE